MARDFSPIRFFMHVPNPLLARFFQNQHKCADPVNPYCTDQVKGYGFRSYLCANLYPKIKNPKRTFVISIA
jgi:hypothetical protein